VSRVSQERRGQIEARIRAASDRLLRGDIPPGGGCDVKTLATEAGVARATLYSSYRHLKEEFEGRRDRARDVGEIADQREAQIDRLKQQITKLRERIGKKDNEIAALKQFRQTAVSRLAAQHDEITRLRNAVASHSNVRSLIHHGDN
jgi:chromosome segregation ATPase